MLSNKIFQGIKTGWTDKAGGCLASYFMSKKIFVLIVVLGCENNSKRFSETELLYKFSKSKYRKRRRDKFKKWNFNLFV